MNSNPRIPSRLSMNSPFNDQSGGRPKKSTKSFLSTLRPGTGVPLRSAMSSINENSFNFSHNRPVTGYAGSNSDLNETPSRIDRKHYSSYGTKFDQSKL